MNINTKLGLSAVRQIFKHPKQNEALLQLELSLLRKNFEFNDKAHLQIHWTATGEKFDLAYATTCISSWEHTAFSKCSKLLLLHMRYFDDIFGVWPHSEVEFKELFMS